METTYCFIARDGVGDWVYAYRNNVGEAWSSLGLKSRVVFRIAFTFGGGNAFEVQLENSPLPQCCQLTSANIRGPRAGIFFHVSDQWRSSTAV
jgi:hypothetical protein